MFHHKAYSWLVSITLLVCIAMPLSAGDLPTVQDLVNEVSQTQFVSYMLEVENMGLGLFDSNYNQGYRSRGIWSSGRDLGNQEAEAYLVQKFGNMGLAVTVQGAYKNIVAELTGTVTPEKIYIISGHYDAAIGSSSNPMPGADDNASGVAGTLEIARIFSQYQFESTIRFICWNAEERGQWGAQDYVDNVTKHYGDPSHENIAGMMTFDMILRPANNVNPSAPIDLDVITQPAPTSQKNLDWANTFIAATNTYVPSLATEFSVGRGTDHRPFYEAGYAAFWLAENTLSELISGSNGYYHTSEDATDGLANDPNSPSGFTFDYPFATDVVRATLATIAQEAVIIPEPATLVLLVFGGLALIRRRRK